MARTNAQQWLDKWGQRMGTAGPFIQAGVQRVQTAPGQSAAASAQLFAQRINEAITSGLWAKRVGSVSLQDWQQAMITKGIPRLTQGIAVAQKTKGPQITALLAAVDQASAAAKALPKGSLENSIQRAVTFMRTMSQLAPKRTGAG